MSTGHLLAARGLRAELQPRTGITGPFQWGVVSSINTGPPPSVNVYLDGAAVITNNVFYLKSYSPVVNDVVLVARMQGQAKSARVVLASLASGPVINEVTSLTGGTDITVSGGDGAGHGAVTVGITNNSIGDAQMADSSTKFRRLTFEDGVTHVTSIQSPSGFTPTASTWTDFGSSVTITPAVTSKLQIWLDVTTSIAASGVQIQMRIVLDGGALTAVASLHTWLNGGYFCLPLIDFSGNCSAGAHTLQPQIWAGNAFALTFLGNGTQLRVLAVPST